MAIRIVRLGSDRAKDEGLRVGTVWRPPRGVRKEDYARKNIYDVWFPNMASFKGKDFLAPGYAITFEDLEGWEAKTGVTEGSGDVLLTSPLKVVGGTRSPMNPIAVF